MPDKCKPQGGNGKIRGGQQPTEGDMEKKKPLTRKQVIRLLRKLDDGWPQDLEIFVGDGDFCLYESPPLLRDSGGVDPDGAIEIFAHIHADGGGW
jgi:hypothetical protein